MDKTVEKVEIKSQETKNNFELKKCNSELENVKNNRKIQSNLKNVAENIKFAKSTKEQENVKISAWIRALFVVYPSLPNIISVIDNIVLQRASSIVPCSGIYSGASSTISEIEKVIDMSDRKMKLLNIVALIREILSSLGSDDYAIVDMKFFRRMKTSTIAERLQLEERSVFRRINKAIERSVKFCNENFYDSRFFETEVKGESWIREIYNKSMQEQASNKLRSQRNMKVRN